MTQVLSEKQPHAAASPKEIDAAVFDMDGLLLDTERVYRRIMQGLCAEWNISVSHEIFAACTGSPQNENRRIYRRYFGKDFDADSYEAEFSRRAKAEIAKGVAVKQGAVEMLRELSMRNIPVAVATSSGAHARNQLENAGLLEYLDTVVTRADVQNGKPHPEPFLAAASRLGRAPERCIAFEDSHNGVRSAHAAGLATVMVPDLLAPTDEMVQMCVAIAPSLLHFMTELDHFFGKTGRSAGV